MNYTTKQHKTTGRKDEQHEESTAYYEVTYKDLSHNLSKHYVHTYVQMCICTYNNIIEVLERGSIGGLSGGGYRE